ncbi:MAG: sulfite oxidase [Acidobacteriaceae bacterium]|nr:sulfite oxidase [Acidobacteriaceae bacterium]
MRLTRRTVFLMSAAGLVRRSAFPAEKPGLIINSARPKDYEMPLEGFRDWITPEEHFFVRNHHYTPEVKLESWSLRVDGVVGNAATFSLDDLKKMPRQSVVAVVECAGNGRVFYEPHVAGMQWKYGSVANARWTGVRLADVLKKAGIKDSATEILFDGEDVPISTMPKFQRTITVKKALDPDTLLAYEWNGRAIPMEHGFPLRLIAPGWASDSWVKWVKHIEVLDHEFDGFWMKTAYRHPLKPVPPGTSVPPDQMVPVTDLSVKSVIATPAGNWAAPGRVKISGAAWSNGSEITGVDVSTDGGQSWKAAALGRDKAKYAWRLWELDWTPPQEGNYKLLARAKDSFGNTQPLEQPWNPSGYLWNVAAPKELVVSRTEVKPETISAAQPGPHPPGYDAACLTCHGEDVIRMQRLNSGQWDREVAKMVNWGAQMKPGQKDAIVEYLKSNFRQ